MGSRPIALVTGGSKGIGAAIAVTLARDGFDIWLNYRTDHDGARSVAEKVGEQGGSCRLLCFDVSEAAGVAVALEPLLEKEIPYALINNAGLNKDALLAWMTNAEWNDVLSTSLDGFFFVTKAVVTGMLRKRKGRIVNIVSTSGQSGVGGQVNYSAAKAGLIGATKSLAVEIARRNILVNAVSPGFIETEMTRALPREQILASIPLGRLGSPMEVAEVVSFLCSDRASYITGQVISVNGGIYR